MAEADIKGTTAKWYVIQTYSAYENTVKTTIEKIVAGRGMQDKVPAVYIPTETVTEKVERKKKDKDTGKETIYWETKTYERKIFPGYVLVKMIYDNDVWHVLKGIRGVVGFLASDYNAKGDPIPSPLPTAEVKAMGITECYEKGDLVRISEPDSVYTDWVAVISGVDAENVYFENADTKENGILPISAKIMPFVPDYKIGDTVVVCMEGNAFNGQVGTVEDIDLEDAKEVYLSFDGFVVNLPLSTRLEHYKFVPTYMVGDTVRMLSGNAKGFTAVVRNIDLDNNQVEVTYTMFNRPQTLFCALDQVELVSQ